MFLFATDVLLKGVWETVAELKDPELRRLASALPDTVLQSRADSTTKKYLYAFQRWRVWAEARSEVTVFPVNEVHCALYLQHLGETTKSKAAVEEAVNGISWVQQVAGLSPIVESPFVRLTVSGLQRQLAKPKSRKEPVTREILVELAGNLTPDSSLGEIRIVAIALLGFSAFLRYDELSSLRCCDIKFTETSMEVHILSSKTDQYRQGDTVLVARTGNATCPVMVLERYFEKAELDKDSIGHIFRGIVKTKHGEKLRASGKLSYTRMRELFLQKIAELGYNPKQFGLHSLRAGGATAAANAAVPDRLFKRHGRWRSELAKDGYVKDSVSSLMSVSESLNL